MLKIGNGLSRVALISVGLVALAGCGGGGAIGGTGGNASVGFYVGDAFGDDYSQVWTTLYHVDASVNGSSWKPVFDNPTGMQVNLSALSGTVQFMGAMNMSAGNYTQVRITMADHMKLVATNGTVTSPPVAAPGGNAAGGKYMFAVAMPVNLGSGQMANMALDFKLANFQMLGGVLQMSVQQMDPGRFGGMQHLGWLHGTVSSLNPGVGFLLRMGMMHPLSVQMSASTLVTSESTGQAVTLADGQSVDIQGTVDPSTRVITASSIQVHSAGSGSTYANLEGPVASVNFVGGSFTMSPSWAMNFTPNGSTVTIQTNANTVFTKQMMGAGSLSDVTTSGTVMVTGAYDSGTGIITANRVRIF